MNGYDLWKKDREEKDKKESSTSAYEYWKKDRDQKLIAQGISPDLYDALSSTYKRSSALDAQFKKWAADYDGLVNEFRSRFSGRSGTYKDPFLANIGSWTKDYNYRADKLLKDTELLRSSLEQNKDLLGEDLNPMLDEAVKNLAKIREGYSSYNSFYSQFKNDEDSKAEDKYKQWQEAYWATSDETREERGQWYDDSLKKLKTMPDGEEKEELQAKVNRYIRGEGEFSTSDREDKYATGFITPTQDEIAARLSDPAFRENANKAAAVTHIPDAEEAEHRMNLELSGYSERDPMFGDNYFVSDYDGTALVSDGKGGFIHPELKTGKYSNDDRLGIYLSLGEGDIKNSADKDIRSVTWNEGNSKHWDYMTTDEVVYYYGLRAESTEKANQFLDDIQRDLNHRYQLLTNIDTAEYYRNSPWYGKIILNVKALIDDSLYALPAAVSTWSAAANGELVDIYGAGFRGIHQYETITGETASDLNEEFPNFELAGMNAGELYQTFMSGVRSIGMSFVPGGQLITAASAAAHDAVDKYREGATAQQIGVSSATAFGTELLTEQLRLERLKLLKARDVATWSDFWKNVVKSIGVEYGEEGLSYLINGAVDVMNRKSQSEWAEMLEKNDGNYFGLALDILGEANKEGVSGAFAGGGSAAITTVSSSARGVKATKSIGNTIKGQQGGVDSLKAVATEQSPLIDKGLAKYAAKTTAESSDKRVGKLALRSRQATTAAETAAKLQVLESHGYSAKDARDLLRTADTYSMGGQISKSQKAALDKAMSNPDVAGILVNKPISFVDNLGHRITIEQDSTQRIRNLEKIKKTIDAENRIKLAEAGKAVNPDGFVEEDGELKVKTDDGTVSHEDMRYDSTEQGIAYETIYGLGITDAAEANLLLNGHTEADGLTDSEWSEGITDAFLFGRAGVDFDAMATTPTTAKLLDTQRMDAYRMGQTHMGETDTQDNIDLRNALKEEGKRLKRKPGEKGVYVRNQDGSYTKVSDYMAANKDLNKRQTTAIRVMQEFSDVMGARVNLFQAFEENGKKYYINHLGKKIEGNPNGFYDKSTGEIYVAMDAGATKANAFTDTMLFTFAHEVTHFIKDWSPTHFEKIASTLIRQAGFDGKMADLIADQQDKAMRIRKEKISEETALEELVADSMETILRSGRVVETMAKIKKVDAEAHAKLKGWFKKLRRFLRRMVNVYGNQNANTAEGKIVEGFAEDLLQQLEQLFAEGAVEAGRNYQTAREQDIDALAEDGIVFDEATGSVFALRDSFATNDVLSVGRKNFDVKAVAKMISNVTGRSIEDSEKWVRSELTIANMVLANPELLDFAADSRYEAIKKNSDYPQGTVDLSNLCPKREEFTAMFDLLQKTYPNKLFTAQDIAEMRKILSGAGITVACGACFVEDRRQLIGEIADTFIGMWKDAVNTGGPLKKTNADGKKIDLLVTKELATRYGLTPGTKIVATDTNIPNQYDLTTYEGFRLLEKNHPQIAMSFTRYNNSRGQQSARLIEGRAEYKRQILGWSPAKVKSVNNNGGLRIFSFSDFEVVHLLDLVQVVIDCAAKGVKIQGYTNIPAFAKLVRNTGIKLNRSLIPLGDLGYHMEGGKVVLDYDSTEGIDINDANFLDERDNPNVGNIVIGINPTQIGAAMLDPFIDYIIPFHSNKAKAILKKLGTGEWINYKESQHERDISTGKASKKNVNIYTQVINKYNPGNKVDFVNAFLKECQKQGKIPRYAEFLNKEYTESGAYQDEYGAFNYTYREGYHKLLVDFKMFDSNGNILPQGEITPDLDDEFMQELLSAEVDRKSSYQFPQEVYDAIDERFGDHDLAMSDRDSEGNKLSAEQQAFFYQSVVRDENGNLLVLFHGTKNGGYTVFDPKASDDGISLFYTDDIKTASTYALEDVEEIGKTAGDIALPAPKGKLGRLLETGTRKGKGKTGVYRVYLNMKNPLVVEGNGAAWHSIPFRGARAMKTTFRIEGDRFIIDIPGQDSLSFKNDMSSLNDIQKEFTRLFGESVGESAYYQAEIRMEIGKPSGNFMALSGYTTRDIARVAKEEGYDGVIIKDIYDIGMGFAQEPLPPANIYIAFDSNQVKSVDNKNPTSDPDIRYSDRDEGQTMLQDRDFTYTELTAKKPLVGRIIDKNRTVKLTSDGSIDKSWVVSEVLSQCESISTKAPTPTYYVTVADIGKNVEITSKPIEHGFIKYQPKNGKPVPPRSMINARAVLDLPQILANSIEVNRSDRGDNGEVEFSYVLIGITAMETANGSVEYYAVRSVVEARKNQGAILTEANVIGKLHAMNAKKIGMPHAQVSGNNTALTSSSLFAYSVADLLNDVKHEFDDTFSNDVYKHLGITRASTPFSAYLKFQERDTESLSNRALLANAFEGLAQTDLEKQKLQEYKENISKLVEQDAKLKELRSQIKDLSFGSKDILSESNIENRLRNGERSLHGYVVKEIRPGVAKKRQASYALEAKGADGKVIATTYRVSASEDIYKAIATKIAADARQKKIQSLQEEARKTANRIDVYDGKLLRFESAEPLRKVLERAKKKATDKANERRRAALKEVRTRRDISDLKKKIRKDIMDLKKLYTLSKDGTNVVEGMREVAEKAMATAEVLFAENYNENDMILNGVGVATTEDAQKLLAEAKKTMESLNGADGKIEQDLKRKLSKLKKQLKPTFEAEWRRVNEKTATSLMDDLKNAYKSMQNSDKAYIRAAYDSNTIEHLETIKENVGATRIADMTLEQLSELHKAYRMVLHSIRTANNAFTMSRSISGLAEGLLAQVSEKKLPKGKTSAFIQNTLNRYGWNYEKLYYALRRIDIDIFTQLFTNLANSENTVMRDVEEAAARQMELVKQYGYNKWKVNRKIDKDFVDNTGKKFRLTLGEMMSLYAFSRRGTVWDHMEYGGFQFGKTALTDSNPTATYKLNKAQCEAITANLTMEQKRFVEEMQEYLSTVMAEKGNEVSMLLHGVKLFGEKDYFPLHVSGSYKPIVDEAKAKESSGFSTMKNAGFTNAQNKNAKAVFVLEGFMDVWTDHVNEMSRYHGTVPALEDIRRVMNYAPSLETDTDTVAVQAAMESRFGKDAVAYFDSLYREANSGAAREKLTETSQKWLARLRKGSVINKVSVAIQQPGSISRAYAIIPQKYFGGIKGHGALLSGAVKAVGNKWTKAQSKTYEKMLKYAPGVTMAKEIGGFDTASGQSIRSYLMDTGKSVWGKIKTEPAKVAAGAIVNLADDTLANVPNAMDKLAWIEIWRAAERMTAAQNPSMATNTDAFGEKVGELFTETIRATQVYDSMFSKSPLLKSKNTAVQYMVSFMNEPNTTANMIEDAVRCLVRGDTRRAVRTFYSVVKSVIFTNVLKAIWSAARDDDEDETYVEKYIEALVGGLIQDATIFNYIPGARDGWSVLLGYDIERPDLTMFTRVISATENLISLSIKDTSDMTESELAEWEASVDDATWDLIFDCAGALGIGAGNIRMEVNAVENLAKTLASDYETTDNSLEDAVDRAITKSTPKLLRGEEDSKIDKLYDAIVDGDDTYVNRIRSQYKDEASYVSAVKKGLREHDSRIADAAIAYHDGNYTEYDSIMDEIEAEGNFDREIIAGAVKGEHNDMFPSTKESKDTVKAEYDGDDLRRAIVSGDADEIGLVKDNMIQTAIANGKTEDEANKSFMSTARSEIKKAFKEDSIDEDKAVDLLVEYGQEEEAAVDTVNHLAFQLDYPEYKELSMTDVRDWYEYAEGVVPLGIYYDFTMKAKDIEGDDRNGDGKADSGSKKRKIQELARSYGLTGAQIRALMNTQ